MHNMCIQELLHPFIPCLFLKLSGLQPMFYALRQGSGSQ